MKMLGLLLRRDGQLCAPGIRIVSGGPVLIRISGGSITWGLHSFSVRLGWFPGALFTGWPDLDRSVIRPFLEGAASPRLAASPCTGFCLGRVCRVTCSCRFRAARSPFSSGGRPPAAGAPCGCDRGQRLGGRWPLVSAPVSAAPGRRHTHVRTQTPLAAAHTPRTSARTQLGTQTRRRDGGAST